MSAVMACTFLSFHSILFCYQFTMMPPEAASMVVSVEWQIWDKLFFSKPSVFSWANSWIFLSPILATVPCTQCHCQYSRWKIALVKAKPGIFKWLCWGTPKLVSGSIGMTTPPIVRQLNDRAFLQHPVERCRWFHSCYFARWWYLLTLYLQLTVDSFMLKYIWISGKEDPKPNLNCRILMVTNKDTKCTIYFESIANNLVARIVDCVS
jgi:hypothetical protein